VILAGDVGGTKTTLALFEARDGAAALVREVTLPSHDVPSLEAAVARFLGAGPHADIAAACVGIAGPMVDGRVVTTNLPWVVDEQSLADAIPTGRARLINDLEATAHGIWALGEDELVPLQSGAPRHGNLAVIAAGTGLGEAIVVGDGPAGTVIATEGGHADFAPRGELEEDLLRYLRKEFGRVSCERVLSGPGLVNVYRFLRDTGVGRESAEATALMRERDPAAVVTELATRGTDRLSEMALGVFVSVYGAEAGNLALKALAVGGVVVAGGIAPRIMPALGSGAFISAFRDKGRLSSLMETIPVRVALNPKTALLGAARVALSLL
jgi:glucokinase